MRLLVAVTRTMMTTVTDSRPIVVRDGTRRADRRKPVVDAQRLRIKPANRCQAQWTGLGVMLDPFLQVNQILAPGDVAVE